MRALLLALPAAAALASAAPAPSADLARYFKGHSAAFVMLDVRRGTYLRYNPERCRQRFSPCSTFKIPNSLIGLETGVIPNPDYRIKWDGVERPIEAWNRDHTLRTALRDSAVWYYQELARRVGRERMDARVRALSYGNGDTSGGLDQFWLSSSLKISPDEQVEFLRRLYRRELPFSRKNMDQVWDLMKLSESGSTVLRGKTGTAGVVEKQVATMGWFVGVVTRGRDAYIFAANMEGGENPSGRHARQITERILKDRGLL